MSTYLIAELTPTLSYKERERLSASSICGRYEEVIDMMRYGFYPGMGGWGFGFGIAGFIINLIFWLVLIWAIVALVRHFSHSGHFYRDHNEKDDPLEILKIRYAKGEITKKEYEEMMKDIGEEQKA